MLVWLLAGWRGTGVFGGLVATAAACGCFVGSGMVVGLRVAVVWLIYCSAGFCGCALCRFGFGCSGCNVVQCGAIVRFGL